MRRIAEGRGWEGLFEKIKENILLISIFVGIVITSIIYLQDTGRVGKSATR
jgi:hypothetical protein